MQRLIFLPPGGSEETKEDLTSSLEIHISLQYQYYNLILNINSLNYPMKVITTNRLAKQSVHLFNWPQKKKL